ncbi:cupin domain-containing protein, partial [Rhizobium johnstonii]
MNRDWPAFRVTGVLAPNHSHPGEEVAFVIEGNLEYQLEGRKPVTLN